MRKTIEIFQNNVPEIKLGRNLDISQSAVHNIIKIFKEPGGISARQEQESSLSWISGISDLSDGTDGIKNRPSSVIHQSHHIGSGFPLANLCQGLQYVITSTNTS